MEVGKVEMAQRVTVALEDDLTGGKAEQTVRFAFDGTDYEIDLNAKNAAAFGKQLAPYIEHARRAAESYRNATEAAIQLLAGVGSPREQDAYLHYRRAWSTQQLLGGPLADRAAD